MARPGDPEPELRIGCDVALPSEIADSIAQFGERYLDRVFTPRERAEAGDDPVRLAARFAGKEAVIKVIRPLPTDALPLTDIAIVHDAGGAPVVELSGRAAALAKREGLGPIAVSLAHEREVALGTAVSRMHTAASGQDSRSTLAAWIKHRLQSGTRTRGSTPPPTRTATTPSSRRSVGPSTATDD